MLYSHGMPTETPYSIADLARLTGVNVRTIRYYLSQGLLPASGESGPGAHYGEGHLGRLLLTKRLQQQHLPLSEIRARLSTLTDLEITGLATAAPEPTASPGSALDYIRSVLGSGEAPAGMAQATAPAMAPPLPTPRTVEPRSLLRRAMLAPPSMVEPAEGEPLLAAAEAPPPAPGLPVPSAEPSTEPPPIERSQWERLSLGPNVELHIRRPLSRLEQRRVERLIAIARQVLKEGQS